MFSNINIDNSKILIVDDQQDNIKVIATFLKKRFQITVAYDGQQAIEQARLIQPDLTLMDINMPNLNGLDATKQIIKDPLINKHPIIIQTALDDINSLLDGFEVGAVDYVTKPLNMRALEKRIEVHLELSKVVESFRLQSQELDLSNRTKDKFFSIIAHDLKSPFAGLMNLTDLFYKEFDRLEPDQIKSSLGDMSRSLVTVYKLIENLLDWARVQKGQVDINLVDLNLTEIINDIIFILSNSASLKNISIEFSITKKLTVHTDYQILHTILRNLISNAIKFTYKGGKIKILISEDDGNYVIAIQDDGMGMTDDNKKKIFKIDEHNTSVGTEKEKGTGLGLILVKEFVELQSGKIWFESELGKGTTFYFTVPIAK